MLYPIKEIFKQNNQVNVESVGIIKLVFAQRHLTNFQKNKLFKLYIVLFIFHQN